MFLQRLHMLHLRLRNRTRPRLQPAAMQHLLHLAQQDLLRLRVHPLVPSPRRRLPNRIGIHCLLVRV
jgi:hypothetical protein